MDCELLPLPRVPSIGIATDSHITAGDTDIVKVRIMKSADVAGIDFGRVSGAQRCGAIENARDQGVAIVGKLSGGLSSVLRCLIQLGAILLTDMRRLVQARVSGSPNTSANKLSRAVGRRETDRCKKQRYQKSSHSGFPKGAVSHLGIATPRFTGTTFCLEASH